MNIKELRDQLNDLPHELDDYQVILDKVIGENAYSPLKGIDTNRIYIEEDHSCGEAYPLTWKADEAGFDKEEWEEMINNKRFKCVILYPTY